MVIPEVRGSMSNREGTIDDDILSKVTKSNLDSIMKVKDKKGRKPLPKIDDIIKKNGIKQKDPKLNMDQAINYFDDPQEKEQVKKAIQGIFRVGKS